MQTKKENQSAIEMNPSQKEIGTVIWLHGLGADGHDFVPIVTELNLGDALPLRFIFPHAPMRPVTLNNGLVMPAWFDVYSLTNISQFDSKGIAASVSLLETLIAKELQRGIPANKIILAGFSQGSAIALTTGLGYPETLGGILSLSGFLPNANAILSQIRPANLSTPIFIGHGIEDMTIPYGAGLQLCDMLKQNKFKVSWHSYVMGHSVCQDEINDIAEWLRGIFLS